MGRTGSGKSTLINALFRLVELSSGNIKVDNLDIATLDLDILRRRLSVIPQDPVFFLGTIRYVLNSIFICNCKYNLFNLVLCICFRYNLDPGGLYPDSEIWSALEKTQLKDKISNLDNKLETQVSENGDNFSAGEKQLLSLARVILKQSKVS